jgi:Permuted papain-like amidase enzyme, YaeF/YiiX, C92 family
VAEHIDSVASSQLPRLAKDEFYSSIHGGDLLFCAALSGIGKLIEGETHSSFSHVGMCWTAPWLTEWMFLEAVFPQGVRLSKLADYIDGYNGDLVLARRPALTQAQIETELNTGFYLVGEAYDWIEEVSIAVRKIKLFSWLPDLKPSKEKYCSALIQADALETIPYRVTGPDWATPEQIYTDPSVEAVGALLKSAPPLVKLCDLNAKPLDSPIKGPAFAQEVRRRNQKFQQRAIHRT